jgi:hypothetical protein
MLTDILNMIIKLLLDGAGTKLKDSLGAVAGGGDVPYGTAIAELLKGQNLVSETDVEQILKLVLTLLGLGTTEKKALAPACAECPYYKAQATEATAPALPDKTPMSFDIDLAPTTMPYAMALPDAAAAAEDALQQRIRALSS